MTTWGTQIYCPRCKEIQKCKAVSPSTLGMPYRQRLDHSYQKDLHWFRRGRHCFRCGNQFLTGELDEALIDELAYLRTAWLGKAKAQSAVGTRRLLKKTRYEDIPQIEAENFLRAAARWSHPSGQVVDAPKHAERVYLHDLGWAVDFGANTFLPGLAVARGNKKVLEAFAALQAGQMKFREELLKDIQTQIAGCVATQEGLEYNGFYPIHDGHLVFGTQLIDVHAGAEFILQAADPSSFLI